MSEGNVKTPTDGATWRARMGELGPEPIAISSRVARLARVYGIAGKRPAGGSRPRARRSRQPLPGAPRRRPGGGLVRARRRLGVDASDLHLDLLPNRREQVRLNVASCEDQVQVVRVSVASIETMMREVS